MISNWMRKQASQANCSPAMVTLGLVVASAVVVVVYRQVILTTLEIAGIAMAMVAGAAGLAAITIHIVRWHRRQPASLPLDHDTVAGQSLAAGDPASAVRIMDAKPPEPDDARTLAAEARFLESSEVDLAFSPDGKLMVRDRGARES